MHPVKVNTLRHNVVANENKGNSNNIHFVYTWGLGLSVFLARGFPKKDMAKCPLASYLPFGYQKTSISFYYVPIGCVFIAINPERPIMRLWPG